MNWNLETLAFVVIIIAASCGALMAIVSLVCEIIRMTPWYSKRVERMSVETAGQMVLENYIRYDCPHCGHVMLFEHHVENYCARCGHKIEEEEKKKYEKV